MEQTLTDGQKIGKYVKYQRDKRGLTLQEYANKSDLTPSFLLRLEKGTYKSVSLAALSKIAAGLDMSIDEVLSKCQITNSSANVPVFAYYLKERYQLPPQAIEDMRLFLRFIQEKYKEDIAMIKSKHEAYWEESKATKK